MLKLEDYNGERVHYFPGSIEQLANEVEFWFTDSELADMNKEAYEYVTEEHFQFDGKYCKYEFVIEVESGVNELGE